MCISRQLHIGNAVHKAAARRRFDEMCRLANDNAGTIEVTRSGKTYTRKVKAISDGAQSTGKALIQTYAEYLRVQMLKLPADYFRSGKIPSLRTNSEKLANFRQNVSSRTIRNHVRELKAIGLIVAYKFNGSRSDYEIELSPVVLWGEEGEKKSTPEAVAPTPLDTNFPHKQTVETNGNKAIDTGNEEKSHSNGDENGDLNGNKLPGANGLTDCQAVNLKPSPKNGNRGGGGGPRTVVDNSQNVWISADGVWERLHEGQFYRSLPWNQRYLVDSFWQHAKSGLYRNEKFTAIEEIAALESITLGVYLPFLAKEPDDRLLRRYQEEIINSLNVADKYYQRHTDKYPGKPYSIYQPGKGYFDAENPKGFNVAKILRKENWLENRREMAERTVSLALYHIAAHKRGKAPKRYQVMDFNDFVGFYQRKVEKLPKAYQLKFYSQLKM